MDPPSNVAAVKHRACDECRNRKLACTKDPDGCSRCKRESIACHYSPQKQMGRPRKRPTAECEEDATTTTTATTTAKPPEDPVAVSGVNDTAVMDIDPNMNFDFLDFLGPDFISTEPIDMSAIDSQKKPLGSDPLKTNPMQQGLLDFSIDFDPSPLPPKDNPQEMNTDFPSGSPPSLSASQGATPPEAPALGPPGSCGCLASIYLALDSIQRLPSEVGPAMGVARGAAKAGHDVLVCNICSPPLAADMQIPISAFQTTMLLGALLPSIADAYKRILDMVEVETARATAERRRLSFQLSEYGGLWGNFSHVNCNSSHLDGIVMEPALWRITARALLKVDVYGFQSTAGEYSAPGMCFTHRGLKDIIAAMDEKSLMRHAEIDYMVAVHGMPRPRGPAGAEILHSGVQEPPCRRIIAIAKQSLDALVIA